jgi:alginate O-acetyltransferase complex protein AlgI
MLFNSIEYFFFLPIIFVLYWFLASTSLKMQNLLVLLASYTFYCFWDWRFLSIIIFISVFDYFVSLGIYRANGRYFRKILFYFAIFINLGILVFFKYFNFFIENFIVLFSNIGINNHESSLKIILPIGISFYTFLSLSYLIDVYKKKMKPTKNLIELSAALSFFPIIFAGPIHRPIYLIPQFKNKRNYDSEKVIDGLRQILWGLFKKVIVAEMCAKTADLAFSNSTIFSGSTLFIGALFYTFQIYADFSGYSDIAIGSARLFGFNIMRNFAYPYFARDISEFWRRWHISLTQWFRDYIFLPVSYSISRKIKVYTIFRFRTDYLIYSIGILITWSLVGFWHGANWTFIFWGLVNAFLLVSFHISRNIRKKVRKRLRIKKQNKVLIFVETIFTLTITVLVWTIFRSNSIYEALDYIKNILSLSIFEISLPELREISDRGSLRLGLIFITIMIITEWVQRNKQHGLEIRNSINSRFIRWCIYYTLVFLLIGFGGTQQKFIYFQF